MTRDATAVRRWALAGLLVAAVLAAIVAGAAWWRAPEAPALEPLSIAVPMTPHAALLHIAAAKGYFREAGLAVKFSTVSHGKAALDQVVQGQADLASAAEVPFVISVLKGEKLSVAATVASTSDEMAVVARRDRGINGPRDLSGKRVGVTLGTSGEYFLWAFLIRHRLAPNAVTWVDMPPLRMAEELAQGRVDALATWEPVKSEAMARLPGQALPFVEGDAYTVTHLVIGRSEFMASRPGAVEKLTRALLKAEELNRRDPHEAQRLVALQLKLAPEQMTPVWKGLAFRVDLRQSQLTTLEDEARWAMARGYADSGPLPNFLRHIHLDALLAEAPERVAVIR